MILRFLRRHSGGRRGDTAEAAAQERYAGYEIVARPLRSGGAWQVAGSIRRAGDDSGQSHDFVRADTLATRDEAAQMTLLKGRQLIDERGERLLGGD